MANRSPHYGADAMLTNQIARKFWTTLAFFIILALHCNTAKMYCDFASIMMKNEFPLVCRDVDSYLTQYSLARLAVIAQCDGLMRLSPDHGAAPRESF